jgi:hypothetical protein
LKAPIPASQMSFADFLDSSVVVLFFLVAMILFLSAGPGAG